VLIDDPLPEPLIAAATALAVRAVLARWQLGSALPGVLGVLLALMPWAFVGAPLVPWWVLAVGLLMASSGVPTAVRLRALRRCGVVPPAWWWPAVWGMMACGALALIPQPQPMPMAAAAATGAVLWLVSGWIARLILPDAGLPVSGWTLMSTVAGYGSFALFCTWLPLLLPIALLCGRWRGVVLATAMRWAMRTVFAVTPTVQWRCIGAVEHLGRPGVVVANHEGMLDILAMCCLPGAPRVMVAKSWVFRHPILGLAAWAGGVINTDGLETEDYHAPAGLTAGPVGISIFPEGRRSRDGTLGRFRPGAAVMARALGQPLLPVAQAGSRLSIVPGQLWIRPTLTASEVLPPLPAVEGESNRAWMARARQAIRAGRQDAQRRLLSAHLPALARRESRIGLPWSWRRRAAAGERDLLPVLLNAWEHPPEDEFLPWLVIGAVHGAVPALLRQMAPAAPVLVLETDGEALAAAQFQGATPADPEALPAQMAGLIVTAAVEPLPLAGRLPAWATVVVAESQAPAWSAATGRRIARTSGGWAVLAN
jgi:1-acyl-sn-glycerol-3-phosphate acyltransferase